MSSAVPNKDGSPAEREMYERMKAWALKLDEAHEFIEQERRERLRNAVTADYLANLSGAFKSALYLYEPSPTSGFVEFYKILSRSLPENAG